MVNSWQVLGDELYAAAAAARLEDRAYLHASALRLPGAVLASRPKPPLLGFAWLAGYYCGNACHRLAPASSFPLCVCVCATGSNAICGSHEPVQVVCPPADGVEFLSEEFRALWRKWFPPLLATPAGTGEAEVHSWFPGTAVASDFSSW